MSLIHGHKGIRAAFSLDSMPGRTVEAVKKPSDSQQRTKTGHPRRCGLFWDARSHTLSDKAVLGKARYRHRSGTLTRPRFSRKDARQA